jgi:glyoxylase-like metal-dependent hydrolase (beta-lactamase superfamily II)
MIKWSVGSVKITCITELESAGSVIQEAIPNATKEEIQKIDWLVPYFANADGGLIAHTQSFIVESGKLKILVDTCVGNEKKRIDIKEWGYLNTDYFQKLNESGYSKDNITHVMCTHLHFDHIGFNTILEDGEWVPTFPNAKYIFSKKEFEYWSKMPESEIEDDRQGIRDSVLPVIKHNQHLLVEDNYKLSEEILFIPTPGHTPGHVSVLIKSKGRKALITGDFIHHPCQIENVGWFTLADTDKDLATLTRRRMLEEHSDTDTLVFGSHFSYPIAGRIVKNGLSYKFVL